MAKNGTASNSEVIRRKLTKLIENFEKELESDDLRAKVLALVPCYHELRSLGKALIPKTTAKSGRDRILHYFKKYPYTIINSDELLVVSGIQEYARRTRELRVQFGWAILSGVTANEMADQDEFPLDDVDVKRMKPADYILISLEQDLEAAFRWNVANEIRKEKTSVRNKILEYLRHNVGKKVSGDELRYVADGKTEWARRTRELRTEYGWPLVTKNSGRPDLDVGIYLLEADRQSPKHDRTIPDKVRREVLRRDGYKCSMCNWSHELWNRDDPRHLELHHKQHHADGGANTEENLITLCTVCHDEIHGR